MDNVLSTDAGPPEALVSNLREMLDEMAAYGAADAPPHMRLEASTGSRLIVTWRADLTIDEITARVWSWMETQVSASDGVPLTGAIAVLAADGTILEPPLTDGENFGETTH